ncbi:MAG: hypothetical protein QG608_3751, partial [Actinomycetota bacterium]|nr:hypothetical protein [Actinomycetota bacterium]
MGQTPEDQTLELTVVASDDTISATEPAAESAATGPRTGPEAEAAGRTWHPGPAYLERAELALTGIL